MDPPEEKTITPSDIERLKKVLENLQKSIDAYAVILVLLASITYIGFLQPPGSFDEGGLIGASSRLKSFVYCNSFSFFFSITDLLLCVSGNPDVKPKKIDNPTRRQFARPVVYRLMKLLGVNLLFVVSLTCCMGAYVSAGTVVQKLHITDLKTILISCIIGSSLYTVFIFLLLYLFTYPTLKFFSTASTCCTSGGTRNFEDYLTSLDDKLFDDPDPQNTGQEIRPDIDRSGPSTSNEDPRGKGPALDSSSRKTKDNNPATIQMLCLNKPLHIVKER
jgi:hypothetical protein